MKIDFTNFFSSDFRDVNSSSNVMMPKQEMNGVQMPYKEGGATQSDLPNSPNGGQPPYPVISSRKPLFAN